jgi:hypothetical protein
MKLSPFSRDFIIKKCSNQSHGNSALNAFHETGSWKCRKVQRINRRSYLANGYVEVVDDDMTTTLICLDLKLIHHFIEGTDIDTTDITTRYGHLSIVAHVGGSHRYIQVTQYDNIHPDRGSSWVSSVPSDKFRDSKSIRSRSLPSKSFPINHSSINITSDAL